jgi:GMP synthase-like glutamine amidotransferase
MQPVLILQHLDEDGPAYLGRWLAERGIAVEVRNTQAGQGYPAGIDGYAALAVLGGEMGANDPLPSLRDAERLILDAMRLGRPVLGHCLGGQLMARALGARVGDSPQPEVGWHTVQVHDNPTARDWLGPPGPLPVFQWHYDAFDLPADARLLAGSSACPHQAFAVGPHLGLQFHPELDEPKLLRWVQGIDQRHERARLRHRQTVQDAAAMLADRGPRLAALHRLADRLYARWLAAAPG